MKYFILIISILLSFHTTGHAGWVDDWIVQKNGVSPGSFEGQKRGYMNGGSFSARWYNGTEYPVTAMPPTIKSGCGGIDMFAGAVSFMEFNYLVQKLQAMVTAAPAIAFDLAFNVLCEPCAKAVKSFEAITDSLNQLQFDDCKASKVLVAKAFQPFTDNGKVRAEAESDFSLTTGISDLREDVSAIWKSGNQQPTVDDTAQIAGCPADLKDLFATPGQTVLQAIAIKRGFPTAYVDLARGYIGDVQIQQETSANGTTQIVPKIISPCENNAQSSIDNFFMGNAESRPADGGACVNITDTNANLVQYSTTILDRIVLNMNSQSPHLAPEIAFIENVPLPVYSALKFAVATNQQNNIVITLSDLVARAYAFNMMSDLYRFAINGINTTNKILANQGNASGPTCQIALFEPAIAATHTLATDIYKTLTRLEKSYSTMTAEKESIMAYSMRLEAFESITTANISKIMYTASR